MGNRVRILEDLTIFNWELVCPEAAWIKIEAVFGVLDCSLRLCPEEVCEF